MEKELGFTRDVRPNGVSGWRVRIRKERKSIANKFFSDSKYGGPDASYAFAKQYRDEMADKHGVETTRHVNSALFMVRQKMNLTQADAAKLLHASPLTFFRWERSADECPKVIHELLEYTSTKSKPFPIITQDQLKGLRSKIGFNRTQMAELIGIRYDAYSRWENGVTKPGGWCLVFFSAIADGWKGLVK